MYEFSCGIVTGLFHYCGNMSGDFCVSVLDNYDNGQFVHVLLSCTFVFVMEYILCRDAYHQQCFRESKQLHTQVLYRVVHA